MTSVPTLLPHIYIYIITPCSLTNFACHLVGVTPLAAVACPVCSQTRHTHIHICAALVFEGIGFFDVGLAVFTGRLAWLADRIVPCGPRQAARSREEWVAVLKKRLQPVARRSSGSVANKRQ